MQRIMLFLIRLYRIYLSPLKAASCRFYPTCSAYAYEAILKYGAWKGSVMSVKRIVKCHPYHPGGYDPVK